MYTNIGIDKIHLYDFDGDKITEQEGLVIQQYTGLKDRNGKEIYEGDVVREHHAGLCYDEEFFQLEVVNWDTFGYQPFMRVIGGIVHDYANNLKEFVVIGNIYENPELLK
jgi:uncharacterized phage protein (TIGR01671 family)